MGQEAWDERHYGYKPVPGFGGQFSTEQGPALWNAITERHRQTQVPIGSGNVDVGIDPTQTRSIGGGTLRARRRGVSSMPSAGPSTDLPYSRFIGSLLGGLARIRRFGDPKNTDAAGNDRRFDPIELTNVIRNAQKAGLRPDQIRSVLSQSGRRDATHNARVEAR
jgi:hypothetical protein